jgi:uncharacterized phage protein (TIGR02218 family)
VKPLSAALTAIYKSRQFCVANLYTWSLVDGTVLRYTSFDTDISFNGNLYSAGGQIGPYWDRSDNKAKWHLKAGVEVDTLVLDAIPGTATVEGTSFLLACRLGFFDGAEVQVDEAAFQLTPGAWVSPIVIPAAQGVVTVFAGRQADITYGRGVVTFSVNSHLELLNQMMPRNLFQAPCVNHFGDASCTVNLETHPGTTNQTVSSGSTPNSLNFTGLGGFAGYYALGKIKGLSGANAGVWRTIKDYVIVTPGVAQTITLTNPYGTAPSPGDTFRIYPGCNKSLTDPNGCPKSNNTANFRATPNVPQPEQAV